MSAPRLYIDQRLAHGATIVLEAARAHYLRNVMRLREGATVRPFNGEDGEWRGRIVACGRHRLDISLDERLRAPALEPGPTLVFAPIRRNRLERLVEKTVELGVARLVPVLTRRTVVRLEKSDRLEAIAIEAAEQCERLTLPDIEVPVTFPDWLASRVPAGFLLHAEERGDGMPLIHAVRRWPEAEILVGPEGGFADEELSLLRSAPATIPVSLGPLILRAETAAVYAIATWQIARLDA